MFWARECPPRQPRRGRCAFSRYNPCIRFSRYRITLVKRTRQHDWYFRGHGWRTWFATVRCPFRRSCLTADSNLLNKLSHLLICTKLKLLNKKICLNLVAARFFLLAKRRANLRSDLLRIQHFLQKLLMGLVLEWGETPKTALLRFSQQRDWISRGNLGIPHAQVGEPAHRKCFTAPPIGVYPP